MSFFSLERFQDNKYSRAIMAVILFAFLLPLTIWLMWTVGQADASQANILTFFFAFLVIYIIGFLFDIIADHMHISQDKRVINTVGIGKKAGFISIMAIASLWAGYALTTNHMGVSLPMSLGIEQQQAMDMLYKTVDSPFLEEMFVRGFLMVTIAGILQRFTGNKMASFLAGLVFSATFFGAVHWLAYQAEISLILTATFWGAIAGVIMWVSASILPNILFHYGNNAPLYLAMVGAAWLVMPLLVGITLAIVAVNVLIAHKKGVRWWASTLNPA